YLCHLIFFFSSRRRHTRCYRDWSSDVCSSDLSRIAREHDVELVSMEDLLKSSDFISLHATATPETHHLLDARTLALAKPGVRIRSEERRVGKEWRSRRAREQ